MRKNIKSTQSLVDRLGELNDIHQKSIESGRSSGDMMVYKAIEDGILDKIIIRPKSLLGVRLNINA